MRTSGPSGSRGRNRATVLVRYIATMLEFAVQEGLNRQVLVEGAGLDGVDLQRGDARVPLSVLVALWQLIRKGTADPGYGIRFGATLRTRQLGLLGSAMSYSASLRVALRRFVRYRGLIAESLELTLETHERHCVAFADVDPLFGAGLPYAVDTLFAGVLSVLREVSGAEIVPVDVSFNYAQPSNTLEHTRFFRCPLRFGAKDSKLVLLDRDLDLPLPRGDEQVAGYLSAHAEQVLRTLVTGGASITERVRTAIWVALGEGSPTLSGIASALQLPTRTLQRRLAQEDTSFNAEADHVRSVMASALLRDRTVGIDEVAFVLGYSEASAFYRSFKRWTGRTPEQYRKETG